MFDVATPGHYELTLVDASGLRIEKSVELRRGDQTWEFAKETSTVEVSHASSDLWLRFVRSSVVGWIPLDVDAQVGVASRVPLSGVVVAGETTRLEIDDSR